MSHAGRFVWRELVAANPTAVAGFYSELFGWSTTAVDMGQPEPYTMLRHPGLDEDVGGATAPAMANVPPHWLDYISVDDVDAALETVKAKGGTAITEAMDIPVGRFAVVQDPSGATFALFKSQTPGASDTDRTPPVGTFCWSQLMSDSLDQVVPFYEAVFGWTAAVQDSGQVWFSRGDKVVASAMPKPNPQSPDAWLKYVAVDDADAAFAKAQGLGATPYMPWRALHLPCTPGHPQSELAEHLGHADPDSARSGGRTHPVDAGRRRPGRWSGRCAHRR